ncbi:MAG: ATP-binding cassette domain-containing protein [Methylotetracoccus sp.]
MPDSVAHPIIEFRAICKRFGETQALKDVSFTVFSGEIHAILGENGAGKSTLMKLIMGIHRADRGSIMYRGRQVEFRSPRVAITEGIGMLYQHSSLIPSLTVKENLLLGDRGTGYLLRNEQITPDQEGGFLSGIRLANPVYLLARSEGQRVEIFRLLSKGAEILILDEPTAVLSPLESDALFEKLLALKAAGKTVILVTHKLAEVEKHADRVTVLRKGRHVGTWLKGEKNTTSLADLMVGEDRTNERYILPKTDFGSTVLSVAGLTLHGNSKDGRSSLKDLSFEIRAGECLGVAGVAGNGQKELIDVLTGRLPGFQGEITYLGRSLYHEDGASFAYIPDNARETAVAWELSVLENVMLKDFRYSPYAQGLLLRHSILREEARLRLRTFNVTYSGLDDSVEFLSGGNLQKLILARELSRKPKLIIAVNPTAGLDIKATAAAHAYLRQKKNEGCALLIASSDLDEIMILADQIIVMFHGRSMGILTRDKATMSTIGKMMGGLSMPNTGSTQQSLLF